ncbi:proton-coupled zinc antiporter SLC30A1-like [Hemicordylus capensis]|uniref:proton-coupled zinc antiporter SLC30A1-like n=1 Tax=Hemicordylus capensis TaxID=884348 RepID=UPI002303C707|nr:proton-coupled zinc antiporter SLC30A1-like [Hemicordylus capensis]
MAAPWEKPARVGMGSPSPRWAIGSPGWLASQFCLSAALFLVEVAASRTTGSLLLLTCSFHTLGGTLALAVALAEVWLDAGGCPTGRRNTFGWARARVAGTLASAVLLSALCLALIPEALRRVAAPQVTEHALALMGIGAVGIPVHLAGAGLPERHRQDPGRQPCCCCCRKRRRATQAGGSSSHEMEDLLGDGSSANEQAWTDGDREVGPTLSVEKPGRQQALCPGWVVACLGPMAVLLHSAAFHLLWTPCLGHVACLGPCLRPPCWAGDASAPPWHEPAPCWLLYLDPGLALVVAMALLALALPALHRSALVLLQAVPEALDLQLLAWRLQATEGVAALQELHVWQLDGPRSLVATAHVHCLNVGSCEAVLERVRLVFCQHGIHRTTVQPELSAGRARERRGPKGGPVAPWKGDAAPSLAVVMEYETTV